jgi:hypothetical protein
MSDAIHEIAQAAAATSNTATNGFIETSVSRHLDVYPENLNEYNSWRRNQFNEESHLHVVLVWQRGAKWIAS